MLTRRDAKRIGIKACIGKIGYDFCKKHEDNSTSAYGEVAGVMKCFVGVNDEPAPECDISKVDHLILTSGKDWPYYANCKVDMCNGTIEFGDCRVPESGVKKKAYPVIFTEVDDVVLVEVPDLEILTEGKDILDAIGMARDAIGITAISMEGYGGEIPSPSILSEIDIQKGIFVKEGTSFISFVDVDFDIYRRKES